MTNLDDCAANPYSGGHEAELWEVCVRRDIEAFLAQDWDLCANDFYAQGFIGLDGAHSSSPSDWSLAFPTLDHYRSAWIEQSREFASRSYVDDPRSALYTAMSLPRIEIDGSDALVHKRLTGQLAEPGGAITVLNWQSIFFAIRIAGEWKLRGFVGYLPNDSPR